MSYTLNLTTLKRPTRMREANSTQYAANRTLGGTYGRDYFGTNKRIWTLEYENLNVTDYATINTIYQTYLSTKVVVPLAITETNLTAAANVHVDFLERDFTIPGSSYISGNVLILTEA